MRVKHSALCALLVLLCACAALAQDSTPSTPCGGGSFARGLGRDSKTMLHGFADAPRNAIRPKNLAWEIPVGAASGLLIAYADTKTENHFNNPTSEKNWSRGSDVGVGLLLGAGAVSWVAGCAGDHPTLANNAFHAMVAAGYGQLINLALKESFRRQYPYQAGSTGDFFARSRAGSFTSGHATTSFAFAAAISKRYPHKPWVWIASYGLATGLSIARLPGKKHYPSDILVGAAVGIATGTYIADHATP